MKHNVTKQRSVSRISVRIEPDGFRKVLPELFCVPTGIWLE